MDKKVAILILAIFAGASAVAGAFGQEKTSQALLNDGFMLAGIDGKLNGSDSNDVWFFVLASDANDGRVRVGANTSLQILPCSTLERMTADMKDRGGQDYRIAARVTKYKGRNFLFPVYFLPISYGKDSQPSSPTDANSADTSPTAQTQPGLLPPDPNDKLAIPKEVIERLSDKPTVYRRPIEKQDGQDQKQQTIKQDYMLADRTGFIRYTRSNTQYEFILDGLGRSVQQTSFRLLPCQVLEQAERESAGGTRQPGQIRLKIAGIVTEYKGDKYLLLQRATRVYSHGNFDR